MHTLAGPVGVRGASALISAPLLSFQEVILPKAWPRHCSLPPPPTPGLGLPAAGKEGHPTLSNPRGSQPRTEQDGGNAKSYESRDLIQGLVPGISNLCPSLSGQFITDVTLEEREVGPHPSKALPGLDTLHQRRH